MAPLRIDLITHIDGLEFVDARRDRLATIFGGVPAFVISRQHLIAKCGPTNDALTLTLAEHKFPTRSLRQIVTAEAREV